MSKPKPKDVAWSVHGSQKMTQVWSQDAPTPLTAAPPRRWRAALGTLPMPVYARADSFTPSVWNTWEEISSLQLTAPTAWAGGNVLQILTAWVNFDNRNRTEMIGIGPSSPAGTARVAVDPGGQFYTGKTRGFQVFWLWTNIASGQVLKAWGKAGLPTIGTLSDLCHIALLVGGRAGGAMP